MEGITLPLAFMHIHLTDSDISQMSEPLRSYFLDWVPGHLAKKTQAVKPIGQHRREPEATSTPIQLLLPLKNPTPEEKANHYHVRLTQLFDAGITKAGMPVRVRLKGDLAKQLGRDYINNLEISHRGTIFYDGQEFDKPSPLATKVNRSPMNGWEYVAVKKNNEWVYLNELREIWRKSNG